MAFDMEPVLDGYGFGFDDIASGECAAREPIITFTRPRVLETDGYPVTATEYDRNGLSTVEQAVNVSCHDYQRLIALGAPVLDCAGCPGKPKCR